MRYTPLAYARAFAELALEVKSETTEHDLVKRFVATVVKNGDAAKLPKIFAEADKLVRKATGRDLWHIEVARKLKAPAKELVKGIAKPHDVVSETVNPELIAGMRITKNDERQFDASLKRALDHLFA